jgi:hypothetical protein
MKNIIEWYISDINVATRIYISSVSTDIASSVYGAMCVSQVLYDVKITLKKYQLIRFLHIDKLLTNLINVPYFTAKSDFVVRESTKNQMIAYSKTINNNIICILNVLNIWIIMIGFFILIIGTLEVLKLRYGKGAKLLAGPIKHNKFHQTYFLSK